jgi:hypothetical protein
MSHVRKLEAYDEEIASVDHLRETQVLKASMECKAARSAMRQMPCLRSPFRNMPKGKKEHDENNILALVTEIRATIVSTLSGIHVVLAVISKFPTLRNRAVSVRGRDIQRDISHGVSCIRGRRSEGEEGDRGTGAKADREALGRRVNHRRRRPSESHP